jgi:hypothetical protein
MALLSIGGHARHPELDVGPFVGSGLTVPAGQTREREGGPQCAVGGGGWWSASWEPRLGATSTDSSTPQRTDQRARTELTVNAHGDGGRVLARSVGCQRGVDRLISVEGARRREPHRHLPHQTTHHVRLQQSVPSPWFAAREGRRVNQVTWNFSGGRLWNDRVNWDVRFPSKE